MTRRALACDGKWRGASVATTPCALACEHEGAAEPVRMSGSPAAWSRGPLPVTLRP